MAETEISQQYCVRWNSHLCSLSTAFPQLLDQEKFVDVTLACEGQQVHCHKVVLAACSQYFDSLLSENPCKHPIIILPNDIKLWTIQALVEFMYKGQVNVSQAGLPDLVKSGDLLQIRGLCNTDIASGLTVENNNSSNNNNGAGDSETTTTTAKVSKVPSMIPPTAHMASMGKKEMSLGDAGRSSSIEDETQIKTEAYDVEDEVDNDDPKHPEKAKKPPIIDSTTITTIQASTSSLGQIRVKPRENLFENYKLDTEAQTQQIHRDECEVVQVTPGSNGSTNIPQSLKFNRSVMEVKPIISGNAFSLTNIDEENFFSLDDDEDDNDFDMQEMLPNVSISMEEGEIDNFSTHFMDQKQQQQQYLPRLMPKPFAPPENNKDLSSGFLLRNPRGSQTRAYTEEELITALNEIKTGLSIYKASQKYRVPRKTLRNWMKRWQIKSVHPMPIQLQRAAIKRKKERDEMLASIGTTPKKEVGGEEIIVVQSEGNY